MSMTNPYRTMIARLAAALQQQVFLDPEMDGNDLPRQACALLAQPEPEVPTDDEIEEWADACSEAPLEEMDPEVHGWRRCFTAKEFSETIHAAIARWGRPTPQPVAVSERLPGLEDCDEQGRCWLWERDCGYTGRKWALVDRAWSLSQSDEDLSVYTHWLPANALPTPEATND